MYKSESSLIKARELPYFFKSHTIIYEIFEQYIEDIINKMCKVYNANSYEVSCDICTGGWSAKGLEYKINFNVYDAPCASFRLFITNRFSDSDIYDISFSLSLDGYKNYFQSGMTVANNGDDIRDKDQERHEFEKRLEKWKSLCMRYII